MLSAIHFNLDKSKILSSGNGLRESLTNKETNFLLMSTLTMFLT